MFYGFERPFELMFFILGFQKSNFYEVEEFAFQVGDWPLKNHNLPSGRHRMRLCKVDEAKIEGVERQCELICTSWAAEKLVGRSRGSEV
jgi:hypothetical protein